LPLTLAGYSGIWIARALPADGRLVSIEGDERHAAHAREAFRRAGVADRVDLLVGEALDTLPTLAGPFDAVFLDADKAPLPRYLDEAMRLLCSYEWPGNVRELEHCLRRALIFTRGFAIQRDDLLRAMESKPGSAVPTGHAGADDQLRAFLAGYLDMNAGPDCEPRLMAMIEKELLLEALRRANGNQSKAAELLGISRFTLQRKMEKYNLT